MALQFGRSAHTDTFTRDNLPPFEQWPDIPLDGFDYPEYLNAAVELTDRMVERGFGDHIALIGNGRRRTYKELADWTNRLAHALVENYGVKPGNRVLIRSANNPAHGRLLARGDQSRRRRRQHHADAARRRIGQDRRQGGDRARAVRQRHADELVACAKTSRFLKQVVGFDGTANHDAELDRVALSKPVRFEAVKTGRDDVALLGFTSGTTGEPKATMHFHRDLLIIADGYAKEILKVTPDDVFVGSPPLAFTFGLGGLAIFPLRFGATATLLENAAPAEHDQDHRDLQGDDLLHRADRLSRDAGGDGQRRRPVVAAARRLGRRNPAGAGVRGLDHENRQADPRRHRLDRDAAYLHLQPARRLQRRHRPAQPVAGYEAKIVDEDMNEVPRGDVGKLAVRGPTGCRYLADARQSDLCARRLEPDRRRLHPGRRAAISISPRATTT